MEERERFVEKEGWVAWFKVLLYLIIASQVISLIATVIGFYQIEGMTSLSWSWLIFGSVLPVVALVGAVTTLKMKKWGFYTLMGTQLVNMVSAFVIFFTSEGNFASSIGALVSCVILALLFISVYSGAASTTGENPFAPKY